MYIETVKHDSLILFPNQGLINTYRYNGLISINFWFNLILVIKKLSQTLWYYH